MTRYYLDQREIEPPPDVSGLAHVLEHVDQFHLSADSAIRRVLVDGLSVDADRHASGNQTPESARKPLRVDIITGSLAEIAHESVEGGLECLAYLEALTPYLASSFELGPDHGDLDKLRQFCNGLYWLDLLLEKLSSGLQVDLDRMPVCGSFAAAHRNGLAAACARLIEAQRGGRFGRVPGILEKEILSRLPAWREIFENIGRKSLRARDEGRSPVIGETGAPKP